MPENRDFSKGERISPSWTHQFFDFFEVEAGARIVPSKIDSPAAREFAAMQLILNDLSFALECLTEADKIGLPDSENVHSRALIFSAVVAYARPFKSGVREIKLAPGYFSGAGQAFDVDLHNYLIAVRDKHVAHSVNEFERCEATGVMVSSKEHGWRAAGVGFTQNTTIGLSKFIVEGAIAQVTNMLGVLNADIDRRRAALYVEIRTKFEASGKWEMAPMFQFANRANAPNRRT